MPTTEHKKAAAAHENAAKAYLAAADSHAKGDAAKCIEYAKVTQQRSQSAAKETDHVKREESAAEVTNTGAR
jgi:hypothetical protein